MRRTEIALIIMLGVLYAAFEGFGIGLLLPILEFVENGGAIPADAGWIWDALFSLSDRLNIPLNLATLLALAFVPILLRQFVYFANISYTALVQARAVSRLRSRAFAGVIHADVSFVAAEEHGHLVSWLTQQATRAGMAVLYFVKLIADAILVASYVLILFVFEWRLTVIALVSIGLISLLARLNIKKSRALGREASAKVNEVYQLIDERVNGVRLIKMRGQEAAESETVGQASRDMEQIQYRAAVLRGTLEMIIDPALMLAAFAVIYIGVGVLDQTLATLGVFLFILLRLNAKAKDVNVDRQYLATFLESLDFVYRTIERAEASEHIVGGTRQFGGLADRVELTDVVFRYSPDSPAVLDHVDLTIPRGSLIALVGRSGAGKSTLVDLIPRLRDVTEGAVLLDGVDVREFELRSLRRKMGFMGQDAVILGTTVRDNLVYGLEREASDSELWEALRKAYADSFVSEMAEGLDEPVGDKGSRLSGGQRQRLALARVLLQDPDILILDEPTSALDSESERYIQKALDDLRGDKTLVVIAHRLSTVQRADELLVLEKGTVQERGTHEQLLEHGGMYRQLFEQQIHA